MLELRNIKKDYPAGSGVVHALKGIDLEFRDSEFVSILGQSGCGKTTLLNIIGGLDGYTEGDLIIGGVSTKNYKDRDWDTYRNHSIGFVFQSYNLIPHQSVLQNVELALTLSGVSKNERRARAKAALESVGLGDQLSKRPSEMSGGQMQRVAIARALVNNPDIILADEPTGALDTETSVQVMEILKEVSKDRLVIMVTHNPELAEKYSSRIIKMLDGRLIHDSAPLTEDEMAELKKKHSVSLPVKGKKAKKVKKPTMSFGTSFMLSLKNLFTKKGRTILTSFAGSIGIIGIALILAISQGTTMYIDYVQETTLSSYPLTIQQQMQDFSAMMSAMTEVKESLESEREPNKIYVDDSMGTMMGAMSATTKNNLEKFKAYIDEHYDELEPYLTGIQYTYNYDLQVFNMVSDLDEDGNPVTVARKVGMDVIFDNMGSAFSGMTELMEMSSSMGGMGMDVFSEMLDNQKLLDEQYDVIAGSWPSEYNEVVLVVTSDNQISKMTLYMLGMRDPSKIEGEMADLMSGNYSSEEIEPFTFDEILNTSFMLLTTEDFYTPDNGKSSYSVEGVDYPVWKDVRKDFDYDQTKYVTENGIELKISGIIRPKKGTASTSISGSIGYTKDLTDFILKQNAESGVISQQKETPEVNVLTGLAFERTKYTPETIGELINKIDDSTMNAFYVYMTDQILNNPEFSDRVQVNDTESFLGMYMLLPAEKQAVIFESVLEAAKADPENESKVTMLCTMLSYGTGGITITPDNFVKLIPALDSQIVLGALAGIPKSEQMPMSISGLIEIAGEEAMSGIYVALSESIKTMTVNDDIFVALLGTLTAEDEAFIQLEETLYSMAPQIDATYESVLDELDDAEEAKPASINFYAVDFESKDKIEEFITAYNDSAEEADKLKYADVMGMLMSSVTTIIDAITYVLIAFVSISLIVSSIMIGVITLISVQERTKEIGILRAIGASKKDVSGMFNAETVIIGFASGLLGVAVTYLLCIPINLILNAVTGIENLKAVLPVGAAIILVAISICLTLVSGIIPSRSAAKKDPVVALRTE